jgi:polysaccharide pyruvyl transferase WcaK-like protein
VKRPVPPSELPGVPTRRAGGSGGAAVRRVLIDNGSPELRNLGDVAMLQAMVRRLRDAFPAARLQVVCDAPDRLATFCGDAEAVSFQGRHLLCRIDTERGARGLYRPLERHPDDLGRLTKLLRDRHPRADVWWSNRRIRRAGHDAAPVASFWRTLRSADLVIAAGGGYVNDVFPWVALDVLGTLRLAQRLGIPTAVMGQGLGPITSDTVRRLAAVTLGAAGLVGLRERLASIPLLRALGVDLRHVTVTGDDALEAAMDVPPDGPHAAPADPARHIGVNVRVADYANVGHAALEPLRAALHRAARRQGAALLPLPIAQHAFDDDRSTLRRVLAPAGDDATADAGRAVDAGEWIVTPADVIRQVSRCRVVVTGSYHAAVFALAQGRPVVALTRSRYYDDKFAGLADLFGRGCWTVAGEDPAGDALVAAVDQAWQSADAVRAPLIAKARELVAAARQAYNRLPTLIR